MADAIVQVPPIPTGGTNQVMDVSAVTREDGAGTVVNRGRVVVSDPVNPSSFANVSPIGELAVAMRLDSIEAQLKRIARLLEIQNDVEVSIDDVE